MKKWKLGNFGKFLGGYLIILLLTAVTLMTACKESPWSNPNHDTACDSVMVSQSVDAYVNPQFTSVEEVLDFRQQMHENFTVDSIFRTMPEQVLNNVSSVLLKKSSTIDKKSIVEEYRANSTVYDNLPVPQQSNATTQEIDLGSTDLGSRQNETNVISTSYQYRTDTINGKPVKIQIKKEESYAKQ